MAAALPFSERGPAECKPAGGSQPCLALGAKLKNGKGSFVGIHAAHKIAVIENEIGSLGVDGALVANAHAEAQG